MFRNLFPYTNFHDLNMDWIIKSIKMLFSKSVFTVNNTAPDETGNVNLPTVAGVSSVNGVGADGQGNVAIKGYLSQHYQENIPVNNDYFSGSLKNEGYGNTVSLNGTITVITAPPADTQIMDASVLNSKPAFNAVYPAWNISTGALYEVILLTTGQLKFANILPDVGEQIRINCVYANNNRNVPIVAQ